MLKIINMQNDPVVLISSEFPKYVIPLIDTAEESIDIIVYDWRFYKSDPANAVSLFNASISRAVNRGVSVRCLVNSYEVRNNLNQMGCWAKKLISKNLLHTKLIIVDGVGVVIGSHNYTQQAFCSNHEASVFVHFNSRDNQLVKYFNNLFGL